MHIMFQKQSTCDLGASTRQLSHPTSLTALLFEGGDFASTEVEAAIFYSRLPLLRVWTSEHT